MEGRGSQAKLSNSYRPVWTYSCELSLSPFLMGLERVRIGAWDLTSDPWFCVFVPLRPLGGSGFFSYLFYFAAQIVIVSHWLLPLFLLISFLPVYSNFHFFSWPMEMLVGLCSARQIRPELLWLEREGRALPMWPPLGPPFSVASRGALRNLRSTALNCRHL